MRSNIPSRLGLANRWTQEAGVAIVALLLGFGILPFVIFLAGSALLGRYEGASAGRIYEGVYRGLGLGSTASWIVVLGPYGLYLISKALRAWWRASARLA
jgi:hypothetical protein